MIRVTLTSGVRAWLLLLFGTMVTAGLVAAQWSCASGGSDSPSGDDGGDDGALGEGGPLPEAGKEGGSSSGGNFTKACLDNAIGYCNQLMTCSPFLLQVQYGDEATCQSQLTPAYCMDIVTALHSGWTPAGLEACVAARQKLTCTDFLYGKPAPSACRPVGTGTPGQACRYDSQCGSGYCRIPPTSMCGTCVLLGNSGSPCTTSADCDVNLVCDGMGACAVPAASMGACNPLTMPCQSGQVCFNGRCEALGGLTASCDADSGIGCDYDQGAYCAMGTCSMITVGTSSSSDTCDNMTDTACSAGGSCLSGTCTPPSSDGQPCEAGTDCFSPSTCNAGTCGLFPASMCH